MESIYYSRDNQINQFVQSVFWQVFFCFFSVYIDADGTNCNELAFQLGTAANGVTSLATRSWNIKVNQFGPLNPLFIFLIEFLFMQVTQYDCNSPNRAPSGCTQYFTGNTVGQVQSYNFNNGNGYQLANQNQKICIR